MSQTPISVVTAAYLIPYIICYLVHLSNTQVVRLALLPLGLASTAWLILTFQAKERREYISFEGCLCVR
jgi:hypothetical protein